jgi:hypothetical protein
MTIPNQNPQQYVPTTPPQAVTPETTSQVPATDAAPGVMAPASQNPALAHEARQFQREAGGGGAACAARADR